MRHYVIQIHASSTTACAGLLLKMESEHRSNILNGNVSVTKLIENGSVPFGNVPDVLGVPLIQPGRTQAGRKLANCLEVQQFNARAAVGRLRFRSTSSGMRAASPRRRPASRQE
jgi:hypothetical protein